ncbi:MAG TPA: Ni/Fe hydrogenase subunit alpha, partial [Sulfurimonas sp. UBA12504]
LKLDESFGECLHMSSKIVKLQAVGCSEAPRGTLFHDYEVDKNGIIQKVNLIIATGNNNLAMNAGLKQVAQTFIDPNNVTDGALNRVEALIRCFDPCLSCSTHALGIVSSNIEVRDHNKNSIQIFKRN